MKTVNLVFENEAWWVVDDNDNNYIHALEVDNYLGIDSRKAQEKAIGWIWNVGWELGDIENPDRHMETLEPAKTISIKDWDGIDHWFVADLFADGEIGKLKEFPNGDAAEEWRIQFR